MAPASSPSSADGWHPRLRVVAAGVTTLVSGLAGWALVLVARGRRLEDGCLINEPGELWAPVRLMAVVRGPIPQDLITFRCESAADPRYHYLFTDLVPLLTAVMATVGCLGLVALVWAVALRRGPFPRQQASSA